MRVQIQKVVVPGMPWMPRQSPVVTSLMFILDLGQGRCADQAQGVQGISLAQNLCLWETRPVLVGWNPAGTKTVLGAI